MRQEMFTVSSAIVGSDAASVPERWRGQVLRGVLSSRENVVPEELPLTQSFIELSHQELRCVRRVREGEGWRQGVQGLRRCARRTRP